MPNELSQGTMQCPFVNGEPFRPYSLVAAQDPEPWLSLARQQQPVFWSDEIGAYCFTRYEDIVTVINDTSTFSSKNMLKFRPIPEPLTQFFPDGHPGSHSMSFMDQPEHGRIRRLANQAFTPRRVADLEPLITEFADRLIDKFADRGHAELLAEFTTQLPMLIMRHIAGAPDDTELDFNAWGPDYFALTESAPPLTAERIKAIGEKSGRLVQWFHQYVAYRAEHPSDDLISALISAQTPEGDAALRHNEVVAVLSAMLSAGIETTAHFIPQALRQILSDPELYDALLADQTLIPTLVEEALRVSTPSRGMRRTAKRDVTVAGVEIPAGTDVFLYLYSANRDDTVFSHPGEFDVQRSAGERHLSFGRGAHFCLGAPLARLESRVAIERLLARLPQLRLAESEHGPVDWQPNVTVPRLMHFNVGWTPAR
jgi:cytochrome P450